MHYEELSIPLAGGLFQIRFHQQVTVLAGISGSDRAALIDAFAGAAAGQIPGGRLVYRDQSGRRVVVRDGNMNYLDDGSNVGMSGLGLVTNAREMRTLLYVGAEDLGLPRPLDDPAGLALQTELLSARGELSRTKHDLEQANHQRAQRERVLGELEKTEATLADLGTSTDRYLHNRAHSLVELERIRSVLAAVEDTPAARRRDERLLAATDEVQSLADDWAGAVEHLDQLVVRFGNRARLGSDQLAELVDIPDTVPAGLAQAIADYESSSARCDHLEEDTSLLASSPLPTNHSDPRVLVLATLDQESLWLTHRRALLASEALQAARAEEERLENDDPTTLNRAEEAHTRAIETAARAERLWLPGVISATVLLSLSMLLPLADIAQIAAPFCFIAGLVALVMMVLIPKAKALKAERSAAATIAATGASSIQEYRQRFADDPGSAKWRRADVIVEDYESAMAEWHELVGDMDVDEVGMLENTVHECAAMQDPRRQQAKATSVQRSLEHARNDLKLSAQRLTTLLSPFDLVLEDLPVAIGAAVHERIQQGRYARLQLELGEAEENERKVTHRLGQYLSTIGFEDGSLEARIGAYGWAIDDARQRARLRAEAPSHEELVAARDQLAADLDRPADSLMSHDGGESAAEGPHVTELRKRRDDLRTQAATITLVDESAIERRAGKLQRRIEALEEELSPEAGVLVARPVDHLVETLVRFRPSWPPAKDDPLPAVLDDPFGAAPPALRAELLDALIEVSKATQIVLLTDDGNVIAWARSEAARGRVSLLEPTTADV